MLGFLLGVDFVLCGFVCVGLVFSFSCETVSPSHYCWFGQDLNFLKDSGNSSFGQCKFQ